MKSKLLAITFLPYGEQGGVYYFVSSISNLDIWYNFVYEETWLLRILRRLGKRESHEPLGQDLEYITVRIKRSLWDLIFRKRIEKRIVKELRRIITEHNECRIEFHYAVPWLSLKCHDVFNRAGLVIHGSDYWKNITSSGRYENLFKNHHISLTTYRQLVSA